LIRNAVREALIDLRLQPSTVFTDDEFKHIQNVLQALRVVNLTEKFCVDEIQIF